jgi:hypothetical protein
MAIPCSACAGRVDATVSNIRKMSLKKIENMARILPVESNTQQKMAGNRGLIYAA